jgi:seryl-tRNA(Sec) selenium transferase
VALAISGDAAQLERRLRGGTLPVIARVADGRLLIDLRTIAPHEDTTLIAALDRAMQ